MRFERLRLCPYGSFDDRVLEFPAASGQGLHLIYGENGAGKSTTLSALRSALFGMAGGENAHRFSSDQLRIGVRLSRVNGEVIEFTRRTARSRPIWSADDTEPLSEEALAPFLGGLDRGRFQTLFGLDHGTMVAGGSELLRGEGEIGRALFAAGLGGQRLAEVEARLDAELKQLWADRSSKARVNELLAEHKALGTRQREAELRPTTYRRERRELDTLRTQEAEDRAVRAQVERSERELRALIQAASLLDPLAQARERAAAFGDAQPLEPEVCERIANLAEEDARLEREQDERSARIRDRERTRIELTTGATRPALALSTQIDTLGARRASYREAVQGANEARLELADATSARDEALRAAGVENTAPLAGGAQEEPLEARLEDRIDTIDRYARELSEAEKDLLACRRDLARAEAEVARAQADMDGLPASLETRFAAELERLRPFRGNVVELEALEVPSAESLDAGVSEVDEALRAAASARDAADMAARELATRESALMAAARAASSG